MSAAERSPADRLSPLVGEVRCQTCPRRAARRDGQSGLVVPQRILGRLKKLARFDIQDAADPVELGHFDLTLGSIDTRHNRLAQVSPISEFVTADPSQSAFRPHFCGDGLGDPVLLLCAHRTYSRPCRSTTCCRKPWCAFWFIPANPSS